MYARRTKYGKRAISRDVADLEKRVASPVTDDLEEQARSRGDAGRTLRGDEIPGTLRKSDREHPSSRLGSGRAISIRESPR